MRLKYEPASVPQHIYVKWLPPPPLEQMDAADAATEAALARIVEIEMYLEASGAEAPPSLLLLYYSQT